MTAATATLPPSGRAAGAPLHLVLPFCLTWASAFAVGKIGLADCPPLLFLGVRFVLAGGILLAVAAALGELRGLGWRVWLMLAGMGLLNHSLYLGLSFCGMTMVSSGLTSVIISGSPVLIAALAPLLFNERMSVRKGLGLLLGVAGVAVIVRGRLGGGEDHPAGILLVGGALLALVAGSLAFKRFAPGVGLATGGGVQALAGGLALLPVGLATEDLGRVALTPSFLASLAYMVVAVSIGAHLLWFALLRRTTATEASAYHFLMPPLGLLFGWLLLGETVHHWDLLGIVPVALGIRLVTRG